MICAADKCKYRFEYVNYDYGRPPSIYMLIRVGRRRRADTTSLTRLVNQRLNTSAPVSHIEATVHNFS